MYLHGTIHTVKRIKNITKASSEDEKKYRRIKSSKKVFTNTFLKYCFSVT